MFSGTGFKILDILCTQREATAEELAAEPHTVENKSTALLIHYSKQAW